MKLYACVVVGGQMVSLAQLIKLTIQTWNTVMYSTILSQVMKPVHMLCHVGI